MGLSNELNDLVNAGKTDMHGFVKAYFDMFLTGGDQDQKRLAMSVHSLLTLALKKTPPDLNVADIKSLIIQENLSLLSQLADTDARVLPLFAIATGRVTQAYEYICAVKRIAQTYMNEAEAMQQFLGLFWDSMSVAKRASVKIGMDESGCPILLGITKTIAVAPRAALVD